MLQLVSPMDNQFKLEWDNKNFLITETATDFKNAGTLRALTSDCWGLSGCTCTFKQSAPKPNNDLCQYPEITLTKQSSSSPMEPGCYAPGKHSIGPITLLYVITPTPVPPIEPLEPIVPVPQPIVPVPQPIVPHPEPLEPANVIIHTPQLALNKPYATLGSTNLYQFNDCAGGAPDAYCIMVKYAYQSFETSVDSVGWTINFVAHKPGTPHVANPAQAVNLATEAYVITGNRIKLTYKLANGDTAFELTSKAPLNCALPPVGVDGTFKLVGDDKHIACWSQP